MDDFEDLLNEVEASRSEALASAMELLASRPVCWRCMSVEVQAAGDECAECPPPPVPPQQRGLLRGPVSAKHPKAAYDPADRPDPAEMTAEEREAELQHLIDTQEYAEPPRSTEWRKRIVPLEQDGPAQLPGWNQGSHLGVYHRGRIVRRGDRTNR